MFLPSYLHPKTTNRVIDLGYRPHRTQLEAHRTFAQCRFMVLVAHRRWGKTKMARHSLIDAAMRYQGEDEGRFSYVAPLLKQAKDIQWSAMKAACKHLFRDGGVTKNEAELTITFPNNARIRLYGSEDPDALRGVYHHGIVLDEVAQMKQKLWDEVVKPSLADKQGWALFIGTPKGFDEFHRIYEGATTGWTMPDGTIYKDPQWKSLLYRVDETGLPWLSEKEMKTQKIGISDATYRQEWLCDFTASADNVLITIDVVTASTQKPVQPADVINSPRILAVDVARYGDDRSVIFKRQGLWCEKPIVRQGLNNMELADLVAAEARQWGYDAIFIDAGRGEGVIDRLRQMGLDRVFEINFGAVPLDPSYDNKRAEMYFRMAEWFESGGRIPNIPELKTELSSITYGYTKTDSKRKIDSKDDIKKTLGRSPDLADALALTFATTVIPRSRVVINGKAGSMYQHDYDPLAQGR